MLGRTTEGRGRAGARVWAWAFACLGWIGDCGTDARCSAGNVANRLACLVLLTDNPDPRIA
jgi:hypothetical protein